MNQYLEFYIKDEEALATFFVSRYKIANHKKSDYVTLIAFRRSELFTTSKMNFFKVISILRECGFTILRHARDTDVYIIRKNGETRKIKKVSFADK